MILNYKDDLFVEVDDIVWDNDGIGSYEYWGFKGYDKGRDYISEFHITGIWIEDVEIIGEDFQFLTDILYEDDRFVDALEYAVKEGIEADRYERNLE